MIHSKNREKKSGSLNQAIAVGEDAKAIRLYDSAGGLGQARGEVPREFFACS
ncbi:MAG: hypothetical protein F6K31_18800 [Symploca sp. SIO2G7]|nr:hypothetical protein [Symploca sp. SIO2G7]